MPTPPVPVPVGQSVVWSVATSVVTFVGNPTSGTATAGLFTGDITQFASGPLSNTNEHITWSGYQIPNLRAGTVVHAIYGSFEAAIIDQNTILGLGMAGTSIGSAPWNGAGGNITGQWSHLIGTSLSLIPTTVMTTSMNQTTGPQTFPPDSIHCTFVGLAIYIDHPPAPSAFINIGRQFSSNVGTN